MVPEQAGGDIGEGTGDTRVKASLAIKSPAVEELGTGGNSIVPTAPPEGQNSLADGFNLEVATTTQLARSVGPPVIRDSRALEQHLVQVKQGGLCWQM